MDRLNSITQKGMLIELIHLLNQRESERIALYGSLAAANNIYFSADFVSFLFSISARLPIDRVAAQTPIFPEWNGSVLCPFYSTLQFKDFSIIGSSFEFQILRPTSGVFVSKLFITDSSNLIQTVFDEKDENNGEVVPSAYIADNLDSANFKTYYLALGDKSNPISAKTVYSFQEKFRLDRYLDGWYEFSIEDGGDANYADWAFRVRASPPIYSQKLIPEAIAETIGRLDFASDPSQVASIVIDAQNLKVNIEVLISFTENYSYPLIITA
jgi:hypothetical protein